MLSHLYSSAQNILLLHSAALMILSINGIQSAGSVLRGFVGNRRSGGVI